MKKLNKKKIKHIFKEGDKREHGFWTIARMHRISERHARRFHKNYKGVKNPRLRIF